MARRDLGVDSALPFFALLQREGANGLPALPDPGSSVKGSRSLEMGGRGALGPMPRKCLGVSFLVTLEP